MKLGGIGSQPFGQQKAYQEPSQDSMSEGLGSLVGALKDFADKQVDIEKDTLYNDVRSKISREFSDLNSYTANAPYFTRTELEDLGIEVTDDSIVDFLEDEGDIVSAARYAKEYHQAAADRIESRYRDMSTPYVAELGKAVTDAVVQYRVPGASAAAASSLKATIDDRIMTADQDAQDSIVAGDLGGVARAYEPLVDLDLMKSNDVAEKVRGAEKIIRTNSYFAGLEQATDEQAVEDTQLRAMNDPRLAQEQKNAIRTAGNARITQIRAQRNRKQDDVYAEGERSFYKGELTFGWVDEKEAADEISRQDATALRTLIANQAAARSGLGSPEQESISDAISYNIQFNAFNVGNNAETMRSRKKSLESQINNLLSKNSITRDQAGKLLEQVETRYNYYRQNPDIVDAEKQIRAITRIDSVDINIAGTAPQKRAYDDFMRRLQEYKDEQGADADIQRFIEDNRDYYSDIQDVTGMGGRSGQSMTAPSAEKLAKKFTFGSAPFVAEELGPQIFLNNYSTKLDGITIPITREGQPEVQEPLAKVVADYIRAPSYGYDAIRTALKNPKTREMLAEKRISVDQMLADAQFYLLDQGVGTDIDSLLYREDERIFYDVLTGGYKIEESGEVQDQ